MINNLDFSDFNNNNNEEFQNFINNEKTFLSNSALEVLNCSVAEAADELKNSEIVDMNEIIFQNLETTFTYTNEAYDYLKTTQQLDFEEAFKNGHKDVSSIATYYLLQEIEDFQSKFIASQTESKTFDWSKYKKLKI